MAETTEVTQAESIRLKIIKMVGYDTAAAAAAIKFVADDHLKFTMFEMQHGRAELNAMEPIPKVMKAIQESKEALALFDTET
ncbi:DUF2560 family protein [Serratia marcescens]|uniref:DUF2560 family protein n=1 Tax=Serratia marcescens TaxID=615 RepID=UPI0007C98081|nr:DUF2560 family protein [Serratia marcescens]OAH25376.1 hypothetical protein AYJ10_11725 [Serratia marcescens]